ncbi:hypothetical protein [Streptodolium elevatio]|uniref:Uncharacterized protein n=1 Tax=Streptodolium elevatio TaxID=3157996 RepID=A0ABV3DBT5_9ACTN
MIVGFELCDESTFEDTREAIYPGKVPEAGGVHTLVVENEDMYVLHEHACLDEYGEPGCFVVWIEDHEGLNCYFHHADLVAGEKATDGLIPGEYLIDARSDEIRGFDYTEYEHVLALHYPEEAE